MAFTGGHQIKIKKKSKTETLHLHKGCVGGRREQWCLLLLLCCTPGAGNSPRLCMAGETARGKSSVHGQLPSTPKACLGKVLLIRKARKTKISGKEIWWGEGKGREGRETAPCRASGTGRRLGPGCDGATPHLCSVKAVSWLYLCKAHSKWLLTLTDSRGCFCTAFEPALNSHSFSSRFENHGMSSVQGRQLQSSWISRCSLQMFSLTLPDPSITSVSISFTSRHHTMAGLEFHSIHRGQKLGRWAWHEHIRSTHSWTPQPVGLHPLGSHCSPLDRECCPWGSQGTWKQPGISAGIQEKQNKGIQGIDGFITSITVVWMLLT